MTVTIIMVVVVIIIIMDILAIVSTGEDMPTTLTLRVTKLFKQKNKFDYFTLSFVNYL